MKKSGWRWQVRVVKTQSRVKKAGFRDGLELVKLGGRGVGEGESWMEMAGCSGARGVRQERGRNVQDKESSFLLISVVLREELCAWRG